MDDFPFGLKRTLVHVGHMAIFVAAFAISPLTAWAAAGDVTATLDNPTPDPIPAGSTAIGAAHFMASPDAGPVRVAIELQAPPGFGALRLDAAGTSSELLNCDDSSATEVVCDWDGDMADGTQSLAIFIDVDPNVAPDTGADLVATVDDTTTQLVLATVFVSSAPPSGTTSLSGVVITDGGVPVFQACVFILSSPSAVFLAITDASGAWSVTGLPDTYSFAIGVVPPFVGTFGPCAEAGPPPVPGPGDLQPVFYDNIWIDLADPLLTGGLGDPFDFAVNAGATVFSSSASGLESCLTAAPPEMVPRPPCVVLAATTTTTTLDVVSSIAATSEPGLETLPLTGSRAPALLATAGLLILLGLGAIATERGSRE